MANSKSDSTSTISLLSQSDKGSEQESAFQSFSTSSGSETVLNSLIKQTLSSKSITLFTPASWIKGLHFLFSTKSERNCLIVSNLSSSTLLIAFLVPSFLFSPPLFGFLTELGLLGVLVAPGPRGDLLARKALLHSVIL